MTTLPSRNVRPWILGAVLAPSLISACLSHEEVLTGPEARAPIGTGGSSAGGAFASTGGEVGVGGTSQTATGGQAGAGDCATDEQCPEQQWCEGGRCLRCGETTSCPPGWVTVPRHGCDWCVPASDCMSEADCGAGRCYPGQACLPGCDPRDPSCCHGNLCDVAGCSGTEDVDCLLVGCAGTASCDGEGVSPATCACDVSSGGWLCSDSSGRVCQ